jgi:hypothetical protein
MFNFKISRVDAAWVAGIYEGEGNFYRNPGHSVMAYQLRIAMDDEDIIKRLKKLIPDGTICNKKRKNGRVGYRFTLIRRRSLIKLLYAIRPFLGNRRKKDINKCLNAYEELKNPNYILHGSSSGYGRHLLIGSKPCKKCIRKHNIVKNNLKRLLRNTKVPCGSRTKYNYGCRCVLCKSSHTKDAMIIYKSRVNNNNAV